MLLEMKFWLLLGFKVSSKPSEWHLLHTRPPGSNETWVFSELILFCGQAGPGSAFLSIEKLRKLQTYPYSHAFQGEKN